jgi:hypothetical protein
MNSFQDSIGKGTNSQTEIILIELTIKVMHRHFQYMNVLLSKLLAQTVNMKFLTVNAGSTVRQTGDWNITAAMPSARSQQHKYDDLARIQVKKRAMPWLRRLAAGLSQRRPVLNPRPVHVQSEGDNVALQQRFSPNTLCFKSRSGLIGIALVLRAWRSGAESL